VNSVTEVWGWEEDMEGWWFDKVEERRSWIWKLWKGRNCNCSLFLGVWSVILDETLFFFFFPRALQERIIKGVQKLG
jgi:hypothetical protein